jgi:hypothetical protein
MNNLFGTYWIFDNTHINWLHQEHVSELTLEDYNLILFDIVPFTKDPFIANLNREIRNNYYNSLKLINKMKYND